MSANEPKDLRLPALRRFAVAITVLNVAGHTVLGFEQSWATPVLCVLVAYATEILLELLEARRAGRRPRFMGPGTAPVDFLLSPHISGMAVSMLLYPGEQLRPMVFAAAAAIASKYIFRVTSAGRSRHFFNPSNFGISATLLAFPTVGIAQPYMFTEKLNPTGAWVFPIVIIAAGTFLNARFTQRFPLAASWLGFFAAQAVVRHYLLGNMLTAALMPMTGVPFLLFTYYMVTDPATTPVPARRQVAFAAWVAACYAVLFALHVVYTLFFALTLACALRGALMHAMALLARRREVAGRVVGERRAEVAVPAALGEPGV